MSEGDLHLDSAQRAVTGGATPGPTQPSLPTAGQLLNTARRAAGLSIDDLAARVKVPVKRLIALEEDRFDDGPDANWVRAVAASVCRQVRLDPTIVLNRLPKAEKPVWVSAPAQTKTGFRDRGAFTLRRSALTPRFSMAALAWLGGRLSAVLLVAVLAVAVVGAVRSWPVESDLRVQVQRIAGLLDASVATSLPAALPDPVLPPDAGPTDTRVGPGLPQDPVASSNDRSLATAAAAPSAAGLPGVSASGLAGPVVTGAVVSEVAPPGAGVKPLLVFRARGWTWIGVTDVHGVSVLNKTLAAGESVSAAGALPLWVVVGRADQTDVEVRGQPLALHPSVPDKVAKFKVD
jgi:cytoskeleton protein RodZ